MTQVERAIEKLPPKKAPGPDEIPNLVLKKCSDVLKHHIHILAQTSFDQGHFPSAFKESTTLVLRKPNKPDYTKPNAYRPIALESTLGKLLESIIAEMLSYLTETHELLPKTHFGGRPRRTADDAMLVLTESIYAAWKEGKIFSALFMDVAGAFNNVHHKRLLHNMRMRRIPEIIINWIGNFLQNRTTRLKFNGTISQSIATEAGIPQGSPLSPILYIIYNSDLLDITPPNSLALGYIDDVGYGVKSRSAEVNIMKLESIMSKAEDWRRKHGAQFEKSKYMLVHFTKSRANLDDATLEIEGMKIAPSEIARYLGVTFDRNLKFRAHMEQVVKKGTKFTLALAGIAGNRWGTDFKHLRCLFNAVIAPRTDYGAIIWHCPDDQFTPALSQIRKLATVQRQAMRRILGCFKTTPTAAMEVESALMPPELRLKEKILKTITRMQTLSPQHPIHTWFNKARQNAQGKKIHCSNIENLIRRFPEYTLHPLETIDPYVRPPWWTLKATIHIDGSKEEAKGFHLTTTAIKNAKTLYIYTDGSGIEGKIGAAMFKATTQQTNLRYLGSERDSLVFAAELEAIQMAIIYIQLHPRQFNECRIFSDSQAALKAIYKPFR